MPLCLGQFLFKLASSPGLLLLRHLDPTPTPQWSFSLTWTYNCKETLSDLLPPDAEA